VTKYTTFITYGSKTALWEMIMHMHPHVDEANAKRISAEALAIPVPPMPLNRGRERAWLVAKHVYAEAKKLKPCG
jgi:hypothetical protein